MLIQKAVIIFVFHHMYARWIVCMLIVDCACTQCAHVVITTNSGGSICEATPCPEKIGLIARHTIHVGASIAASATLSRQRL